MLEEKVEELKVKENLEPDENTEIKRRKFDTSIELNVEAYLQSSLFENELDKINFYKEIESINSLEEIKELKEEFFR
jgi:transcription-repair coupling factor (superfamily II helicase)